MVPYDNGGCVVDRGLLLHALAVEVFESDFSNAGILGGEVVHDCVNVDKVAALRVCLGGGVWW